VAKNSGDPSYKHFASALKDLVDSLVPLTKGRNMDSAGVAKTSPTGEQSVKLRDPIEALLKGVYHGFTDRVVVHEAIHNITDAALYIGKDAGLRELKQYRKFGKFYDEVEAMRNYASESLESIIEGLDPEIARVVRYALSDPHEFLAHISDPRVIGILEKIPYTRTKTVWDKIVDFLASLFGKTPREINLWQAGLDAILRGGELHKSFLQMGDQAKLDLGAAVMRQGAEKANKEGAELAIDFEIGKYSLPDSYPELLALAPRKDLDIGKRAKEFITPNQVGQIAKNPIAGWFMNKVDSIYRQATPRFKDYEKILTPYFKLGRKDRIALTKTLVDIQKPELKEARAQAEFQNTREIFLREQGMKEEHIPTAIRILDILKDVQREDVKSVNRFGRQLADEPMYFPLVHNGKFVVRVEDVNGKELYIEGFDSMMDARTQEAKIRNSFANDPNVRVYSAERMESSSFADDFAMLALSTAPMDFMQKTVQTLRNSVETAPVSFEKKRRDESVGGYAGEHASQKYEFPTTFERARQNRMLDILGWRLRASHKLETRSRLFDEVQVPLLDSGVLSELPNLRSFVGNILNREMGIDISQAKYPDKWAQDAAEIVAKGYDAIDTFVINATSDLKVPFDWSQPRIGDQAARQLTRMWTYITSLMKLGLNVPVIMANALHPTNLALDGLRTAAINGDNPVHALSAMMKSMLYTGGDIPVNRDVRNFLIEAKREGGIDPHQMEEYSIHGSFPLNRARVDKVLQYPRDKVEQFANFTSLLYYYHYFKSVDPKLEGEALKSRVYEAARSFTGNYQSYNTPLMFDKAGTAGQLMTNFSKWHFNQLGRLMKDLQQLGKTNQSVYQGLMPIFATSMMIVAQAGVLGLPLLVEYEALRVLGQKTGWWDMRPLNAWYRELRKALKDKAGVEVPAWVEKGATTALGDEMAQAMGLPSGPDISGTLRHAGFLEIPLVAIEHFHAAIMTTAPLGIKAALSKMGIGKGLSHSEIEDMAKGLPTAVKNAVAINLKSNPGGGYSMYDTSEGQKYMTLSEYEGNMMRLGVPTTNTRKKIDSVYYKKWLDRQREKETTELVQATVANITDPDIVRRNAADLFALAGEAGWKQVETTLQNRAMGLALDYWTRETMRIAKDQSQMRKLRRLYDQRKAREAEE
jgi:hypothetical protein